MVTDPCEDMVTGPAPFRAKLDVPDAAASDVRPTPKAHCVIQDQVTPTNCLD
jgi:hypothetical protein